MDLLHQMTGLSLYVEKLVQNSPDIQQTHTHTHKHTHILTHTHIINLMKYMDRSTASFFVFLLGKRFFGTKLFPSNKMRKVVGDLSRMRVKAGDSTKIFNAGDSTKMLYSIYTIDD